jgi:hypothetical protein
MGKHKPENESPKHQRKKARKYFKIQHRMTREEAHRQRVKLEASILKDMEWSDGWSNYESLKQAEQALEDIKKQQANTTGYCYYRGKQHRVVDTRERPE